MVGLRKPRRSGKRLAGVLGAAVLAAGGVVVTAGPAHAEPFDCEAWVQGSDQRTGAAACWSGSGQYRVVGGCLRVIGGGSYRDAGPTVRVGSISTYTCRSGYVAFDVGVQIQ